MRRLILAVLAVSAFCALAGGAASSANAAICADSFQNVGNYKERVGGVCQSLGTVGKELYIKVIDKGELIAPGVACARVDEPKKGNYSDLGCQKEVTPGTGSYVKIRTTQKAGETTAKWFVNGSSALVPALVKLSKLTSAKATLKTKIGGAEVKFNTTATPEVKGVSLEANGQLTTGGQVTFNGVTTELNGSASAVCTPLGTAEVDGTLGTITSNKGKGGIKLHEGAAVTHVYPETGNTFGRLFFGEFCSLPEEVPVITKAETGNGLVLTDPLGVGNELVEHEITELSALTELWAISETAEHKAIVEGKAGVILTEAHNALKWSGKPDLFAAS